MAGKSPSPNPPHDDSNHKVFFGSVPEIFARSWQSFSIDKSISNRDYFHHPRMLLTSESQSISGQSSRIVIFNYDAMGNRTRATIASPATTATLTRRLTWGQDLAGSPSLQGAGGVGGLLMVEEITSTTNEAYHFHYDGNGNVTEITDHLGASVATYRYDAFGNTLVATGTYAATNRYRFSTKPQDAESGLYYYGYRYLDPVTGRWPSRDPIEEAGGVNLYGFVGNDGIGRIDELGLAYPEVNLEREDPPCKVRRDCEDNRLKIVAISGETIPDDRDSWNETGLDVIEEPIDSRKELVDQVKAAFYAAETPLSPCKKCIQELHISGHGSGAGGVMLNSSKLPIEDFENYSITGEILNLLQNAMCEDGVIRLWSCESGTHPDAKGGIQDLANTLGFSVSGVSGACYSGINNGNHDGPNIEWRHPK